MEAPYPLIPFHATIGTWDFADFGFPDTGFDGGLIIPIGVGREVLSKPYKTLHKVASGHVVEADTWSGIVQIVDHEFRVEILALGDSYLIGRDIIDQAELCFVYGREVRLSFKM